MDDTAPRLVILRGPSSAGKTTLAEDLQRTLGRGTANIGQDHFRRVVLREHDVPDGDNIGLIGRTAEHCLAIGYHVVLEGILAAAHYRSMLADLLRAHPGRSHVFYLDVPLAETLRRHEGRPLRAEVGPDQVRGWYVASDLLGVPGEVVLDGRRSREETLDSVLAHIGSVPPRGSTRSLEVAACAEAPTGTFLTGVFPRHPLERDT